MGDEIDDGSKAGSIGDVETGTVIASSDLVVLYCIHIPLSFKPNGECVISGI